MSLSLAGVFLPPIDAALAEKIESRIPLDMVSPWTARAWPGKRRTGLPWPVGFKPIPTRVKVNMLTWPRGASRFAFGWFLASSNQAAVITNLAFGPTGTTTQQVPLVMFTPGINSNEVFTTQVYCFAPIPLFRVSRGNNSFLNGMYLIPVVDQRYYWWGISCPALNIDGTSVTWSTVWGLLSTALGATIQFDTPNSAYRFPDTSLNLQGDPICQVIDACSSNLGQRIIVDYNGTVSSIQASTGLARRQADDTKNNARTLLAGGDMFASSL
jgi:hypothetical protein